jgi:hypothetical protein
MRSSTAKLLVCALMIGTLCLPSSLSAKQRRGADLIVTRLDGNQAKGELIAVKPEALILRRGGTDLTIPRAKIHSVQILRRSKRGTGTLTGFLAGTLLGVAWGVALGPDPIHGHPALIGGPMGGGLGALIGLCVSHGGKVDSTLVFAGSSNPAEDWDKLRAFSREARRAKRPDAPEP